MDLFGKVTRDERQEQCRVTWIKNKCKGSIQACTGWQSRSVKEFTELLSGNFGESCEANTEIISEITKGSEI